ncbi:MAG TPA: hypothetical protein PK127_01760 [Clostridiales bacterium]|nr:hypothetical protein [Clostridiales bacterium]HPV01192.1 hypothetical protein [Clostridiales bacterium]
MKESAWFNEFKRYLTEEPVPGIDFSKSREAICEKLEKRTVDRSARLRSKRLLVAAAVVACLVAYPVYALTYSYFRELKNSNDNIQVKFQTPTDEIRQLIEDKAAGDAYIESNFGEILRERYETLQPGEAEKIIVRDPEGDGKKFFTSVLSRPQYVDSLDAFADGLAGKEGFGSFRPAMELPGGFRFEKGVYYYTGDYYMTEDEMEALMAEAERNGQNYAVKQITHTDEIERVVTCYKNELDEGATLSVHVQYNSFDTYILPEGSEAEELDLNGIGIVAYGLPDKDGNFTRKAYNLVANDMFYLFQFSKDIGNDSATEIISAFIGLQ